MSQEIEALVSPMKRDNELFQSRYFTHSEKKIENPEAIHTFFQDQPVPSPLCSLKSSIRTSPHSSLSVTPTPIPASSSATLWSLMRRSPTESR